MRVMIAEDSGIIRDGLRRILVNAGVEVADAVGDAEELLAVVGNDPPDAVILDIRMPPTHTDEGLVAAEVIKTRHPQVGVLVLSTYGEPAYAVRLMSIPVSGVGFLLKDRVEDVTALVDALRTVASGKSAVDPEIVAQLLQQGSRQGLATLAEREREVLELMAEGRSNPGIAAELGISSRTVENHASHVFQKLSIPDDAAGNRRVLAVLAWLRNGAPSSD